MPDNGETTRPTEIAVVSLENREAAEICERLSEVRADPYKDFSAFLNQVDEIGAELLTAAVRKALADIAAGRGAGALLIRNLPIPDALRKTPDRPFHDLSEMQPTGTEGILAAVVRTLGEAFSYREWDSGHLVHNKYPIRAHRDVQFGSNAVEFLLHTETPFRDVSPDYLALLCLRGDPTGRAKTVVSDLAGVVDGLDDATKSQLSRPAFAFETDKPVRVLDDGRGVTEPQPVIGERDGARVLEFVGDLVAVDAPAAAALAELSRRVALVAAPVALIRGDLLVLDNRRVVHGRTAIEPRYDGTDRWLQRMLATTRLVGRRPATTEDRLVSDRRYANYPTAYQEVLQSSRR